MKKYLPAIKYFLFFTLLLGLFNFFQVTRLRDRRDNTTRNHSLPFAMDTTSKAYLKGVREKEETTTDYLAVKYSLPTPLLVDAGTDKICYLGYGPDYISLSALASGGTAPYTYSWSPEAGTASSIQVSPSSTTTYTVTVTDLNGQTASDQVTVGVVEARCGQKNDQVLVCHEEKPLCIGASDVAAHLKHGDRLAGCEIVTLLTGLKQEPETPKLTERTTEHFRVFVMPNPFRSSTRFLYELPEDGKISILVYDEAGRVIATIIQAEQKKGKYQEEFSVKRIASGLYFYQALFTTLNKIYSQTGALVVTK